MRKILVPAILALILITAACSDNKKPATAPAPPAPASVSGTSITAPPTTAAPTTTTLPEFLDAPRIQHVCSQLYSFCIDMPTDLVDVDVPDHLVGGYLTLLGRYDVDRATGHVCPLSYKHLPQCEGFDSLGFVASAEPLPGVSQDDAFAQLRTRFDPGIFDQVHTGTFLGNPAMFATFHTDTGGYGPEVDVWHNEVMYSIAANGLNGPADLAQQFLDSFQFVDEPPGNTCPQPPDPATGRCP